jgi:hypothetical protein
VFPRVRIEILTSISSVEFADCYSRRLTTDLDGVPVNLIRLDDLKRNKVASGRLKDRPDLEHCHDPGHESLCQQPARKQHDFGSDGFYVECRLSAHAAQPCARIP